MDVKVVVAVGLCGVLLWFHFAFVLKLLFYALLFCIALALAAIRIGE